jgi:hypothetical protein
MRVLRHELAIGTDTALRLPSGQPVMMVGVRTGDTNVSLWMCDPGEPQVSHVRVFRVVGTGWDFSPAGLVHVGSCIDPQRPLVWHVFEDVEAMLRVGKAP